MELKRSLILGGLAAAGLLVVGFRTYEAIKLQKAIKEDQIIEITPEPVEEPKAATRK